MDGCLKCFKVAPVYIWVSGPTLRKVMLLWSKLTAAACTCETVKVCLPFIYYTVARKTAFKNQSDVSVFVVHWDQPVQRNIHSLFVRLIKGG